MSEAGEGGKEPVGVAFRHRLPPGRWREGVELAGHHQHWHRGGHRPGFAVSFIVALLAIKTFLKYIQKNNLTSFGWYRIILAIISIIVFIKL